MTIVLRRRALLLALHLLSMGALALPLPASAMQILDAADHAEIAAEISATGVNRIALHGDRIAKVVRAPDGFAVEHDAGSATSISGPPARGRKPLRPRRTRMRPSRSSSARRRASPTG